MCVQTLAQTVAANTTKIQILNNLLRALWLPLPLWKQMQPLAPEALTRQDLGTCLDKVTAPQPLDPSGPCQIEASNVIHKMKRPCQPAHQHEGGENQRKLVKTLLHDIWMMVSPKQLSPFCCTKTKIIVRQSKTLEDRKIGKQFAPLRRVLAEQLKVLFPEGDDESAFIVPACDARSQILSIKDRRDGIGEPVFKLAPCGYLS